MAPPREHASYPALRQSWLAPFPARILPNPPCLAHHETAPQREWSPLAARTNARGRRETPKRRPGGISAHKPDRAQCVMFNEVAFDQLQAAQPPPPPPASRSEAAPRLANYLYHNEGNGVECAAGQSAHSLARTNIQIRIEWSRASRSGSAQFLCRPHRSGDAYSGTAPPIEGLPVQPSNSPRSYLRIVTT